jgi:hypothetical protein
VAAAVPGAAVVAGHLSGKGRRGALWGGCCCCQQLGAGGRCLKAAEGGAKRLLRKMLCRCIKHAQKIELRCVVEVSAVRELVLIASDR